MEYDEYRFEKEAFDYYTHLASMGENRYQMYGPGLGNYPLCTLAQLWAQELLKVGLSEVDATSSAVPKRGENPTIRNLRNLADTCTQYAIVSGKLWVE